MTDKLNGRVLYRPRGRDPAEDLNILSDAIAASDADLFSQDDSVIWITAGKKIALTPDILRDVISTFIVTKHPRKNADDWEVEYRPHEPDLMTLRTLLTAKTLNTGSLAQRLPKAPGTPRALPESQQEGVRMRMRSGEPARKIAAEFGVSVEAVEALAR